MRMKQVNFSLSKHTFLCGAYPGMIRLIFPKIKLSLNPATGARFSNFNRLTSNKGFFNIHG